MAVDDLRIYQLDDEQSSYASIFLVVDHSTFSNSKKMLLSVIYPKTNTLDPAGNFNPVTTLLRTDNGSGDETKVTVSDLINDSDVITLIRALFTETSWLNGTRTYTEIDANSFICKVKQVGKMVTVTGTLKINTGEQPPLNEVLITLPASIKTSSQNQYFSSSDDVNDEVIEMYLAANTRTIKAHSDDASTNTVQVYSFTYPADNYLD
jgi:hypothetical protein